MSAIPRVAKVHNLQTAHRNTTQTADLLLKKSADLTESQEFLVFFLEKNGGPITVIGLYFCLTDTLAALWGEYQS